MGEIRKRLEKLVGTLSCGRGRKGIRNDAYVPIVGQSMLSETH